MIRRPPRSTRTDTLFPYTALFRSGRTAEQAPGQFPAVLFGIRARGCHNIPQSLAKKGLRATEMVRAGVDLANRSTRRRREAIRTMDEKDGTPVHGGPGSRTSSYPPGEIPFVRRTSKDRKSTRLKSST